MMHFLSDFPDNNELLQWWQKNQTERNHKVNCHIHTPFSFSAFDDIRQPFEMAVKEDIKVLGINDFFVADGYEAFHENAVYHLIFPEFNIEFIGLLAEEQKSGIRVNDPNNPGRTYFSGKGLNYPFGVSSRYVQKLEQVKAESQKQVQMMLLKTNELLKHIKAPFSFDFERLKKEFAKGLVRERHIAKAIRVRLHEHFNSRSEKISFLEKLYAGKEHKADIDDHTRLEEEIRGNLLKAGGLAYIPEDENAFLPVPEIIEIIIDAGGIPCYPVLLDDKNGNYTGFEEDHQRLADRLAGLGVGCVELIPGRNRFENLIRFVRYMENRGFVVIFGTEHNTPQLMPLTVKASDKQLDPYLEKVAYEGACIVAAHQYLKCRGEEGFIDENGLAKTGRRTEFSILGKAVIEKYLSENQ
ncbi:MAG TPA: hypothetical protein VJ346_06985 [Bacteroidales bacterium]|nr:hypothetical protein [Bacteroidales bacterium]